MAVWFRFDHFAVELSAIPPKTLCMRVHGQAQVLGLHSNIPRVHSQLLSQTPLSVQEIADGSAAVEGHRMCSFEELLKMFLPSFVTKELGINNVIEGLDATNVTLEFLCRTGEQSLRQKVFLCFFIKK